MKPIKRVEIVVESLHEQTVERLIQKAGVDGYTLMRDVAGRGQRGERDVDGLTGATQNVYFLIAASNEAAESLAKAIQPLLHESGGICMLSDAQWLEH